MMPQTQNTKNAKPVAPVVAPTASELDKALGKVTAPETVVKPPETVKPEAKPEAKPDTAALDRILATLPEKVQASIKKLPVESRLEIAQEYFRLAHPEGLASEFATKLTAELPNFIKKLAEEFMVSLDGKAVKVMFPNDSGTPTAVIEDPKAASAVKTAAASKEQWGESSVTYKDGKVMNYSTPGAMGKALGYLMKGWQFRDTTECFTKPYDTNNPKTALKPRFTLVTATKGSGIHIKEIA
jgi:hypothetical protein